MVWTRALPGHFLAPCQYVSGSNTIIPMLTQSLLIRHVRGMQRDNVCVVDVSSCCDIFGWEMFDLSPSGKSSVEETR